MPTKKDLSRDINPGPISGILRYYYFENLHEKICIKSYQNLLIVLFFIRPVDSFVTLAKNLFIVNFDKQCAICATSDSATFCKVLNVILDTLRSSRLRCSM